MTGEWALRGCFFLMGFASAMWLVLDSGWVTA